MDTINADRERASALSQFSRRAFSASSRACSLVSADMREPRQPLHPISSAALVSSLYQRLIGKALASDSANKAFKPRESVMFYVPFVKAEGKLVNIATKMFRTGVVIDADQAPFENRKNAFNSVCVDNIMAEARAANARICTSFVGMQARSEFDVLVDSGLNCFLICALDRRCNRSTVALTHPKNGRLADCTATGLEFLVFVLIGFDPADETLIDFDDPAKLIEVWPARFPDAMQHEPSRRLPDANLFRQLQAGDTLAGREKQIHRIEPLVQRNMRALENRSGANREIFLALITAVVAVLACRNPLAKAAYRAFWAFRPSNSSKVEMVDLLTTYSSLSCSKSSTQNRGSQAYNSPFIEYGHPAGDKRVLVNAECSCIHVRA
jgi:hypothetical protein